MHKLELMKAHCIFLFCTGKKHLNAPFNTSKTFPFSFWWVSPLNTPCNNETVYLHSAAQHCVTDKSVSKETRLSSVNFLLREGVCSELWETEPCRLKQYKAALTGVLGPGQVFFDLAAVPEQQCKTINQIKQIRDVTVHTARMNMKYNQIFTASVAKKIRTSNMAAKVCVRSPESPLYRRHWLWWWKGLGKGSPCDMVGDSSSPSTSTRLSRDLNTGPLMGSHHTS